MAGVLVSGVAGPLVGLFIGRRPHLRIALVFAQCSITIAGWAAVVVFCGATPPHLLVAALFAFTMTGGPVSTVAFAVARDYNSRADHRHRLRRGQRRRFPRRGDGVDRLRRSCSPCSAGRAPRTSGSRCWCRSRCEAFGTWRVFVWVRRVRAVLAGRQREGQVVPVRVSRRFFWDARWQSDGSAPARPGIALSAKGITLHQRSGYCPLRGSGAASRNCFTPLGG